MKDERAIEMLAIKGAEDELARTQKTGTFGQLVQDIMTANQDGWRKLMQNQLKLHHKKQVSL